MRRGAQPAAGQAWVESGEPGTRAGKSFQAGPRRGLSPPVTAEPGAAASCPELQPGPPRGVAQPGSSWGGLFIFCGDSRFSPCLLACAKHAQACTPADVHGEWTIARELLDDRGFVARPTASQHGSGVTQIVSGTNLTFLSWCARELSNTYYAPCTTIVVTLRAGATTRPLYHLKPRDLERPTEAQGHGACKWS